MKNMWKLEMRAKMRNKKGRKPSQIISAEKVPSKEYKDAVIKTSKKDVPEPDKVKEPMPKVVKTYADDIEFMKDHDYKKSKRENMDKKLKSMDSAADRMLQQTKEKRDRLIKRLKSQRK